MLNYTRTLEDGRPAASSFECRVTTAEHNLSPATLLPRLGKEDYCCYATLTLTMLRRRLQLIHVLSSATGSILLVLSLDEYEDLTYG
jgi:DNA-directed RNA polymerase subunit N (RpoN/RPB10)